MQPEAAEASTAHWQSMPMVCSSYLVWSALCFSLLVMYSFRASCTASATKDNAQVFIPQDQATESHMHCACMLAVGALMFLGIMWCAYAYFITRRRGVTRGMRSQLQRLEPYMVLSAVTMLYFLYTPTSREIISLFSCQPVDTLDALQHVAPESSSSPEAKDALKAFTPKNSGWQGVWTSDTSVLCASPVHVGIAIGLGVPGMIVWVFGLPVALWLMLRRDSKVDANGQFKLEDPLVSVAGLCAVYLFFIRSQKML